MYSATLTATTMIPVNGWAIGGAYFVADLITMGVTGKSIGIHADEYHRNNISGSGNDYLIKFSTD